ncbi:protein FAM3B isoform X1 [Arapaima gigas]
MSVIVAWSHGRKVVALVVSCLLSWYLGSLLASVVHTLSASPALPPAASRPPTASSGKPTGFRSFEMWRGDNSEAMVKFIQGIPNGFLVLMATYDEGSNRLKPEAKMEVKKLGSSLIERIAFRSSWVFIGSKGVALPNNLTRERMVHRTPSNNVYGGWPREMLIDGCIPRQPGS